MKNIFLIIILLLTGCTTTTPLKVNIPIPIPCLHKKILPKPYLPIYSLTLKSQPDEVIKAYTTSIQLLQNYIDYSNAI